MVLPGISGSLLLLLLGQYEYLVGVLHDFVDALVGLVDGGTVASVLGPGTVVTTFVAGALVGLFSVAHVIRFALERRREATLAFLVSLIVGALRAPAERIDAATAAWDVRTTAVLVLAAVVGAAVVLLFDRYAGVTY
jgi:putative membrane protein